MEDFSGQTLTFENFSTIHWRIVDKDQFYTFFFQCQPKMILGMRMAKLLPVCLLSYRDTVDHLFLMFSISNRGNKATLQSMAHKFTNFIHWGMKVGAKIIGEWQLHLLLGAQRTFRPFPVQQDRLLQSKQTLAVKRFHKLHTIQIATNWIISQHKTQTRKFLLFLPKYFSI